MKLKLNIQKVKSHITAQIFSINNLFAEMLLAATAKSFCALIAIKTINNKSIII